MITPSSMESISPGEMNQIGLASSETQKPEDNFEQSLWTQSLQMPSTIDQSTNWAKITKEDFFYRKVGAWWFMHRDHGSIKERTEIKWFIDHIDYDKTNRQTFYINLTLATPPKQIIWIIRL